MSKKKSNKSIQTSQQTDNKPAKRKGTGKGANGNFIPCKPGHTANPNGRPKKGNAWSDIFNTLLDAKEINVSYSYLKEKRHVKKTVHLKTKLSMRYALCAEAINKGLQGDAGELYRAIELLANRTIGKPPQYVGVYPETPESPLSDKEKAMLADTLDSDKPYGNKGKRESSK